MVVIDEKEQAAIREAFGPGVNVIFPGTKEWDEFMKKIKEPTKK